MTSDQREIRRKLRILEHAEATGKVSKTCRYFGIGRASFYRWRHAYRLHGEPGLANKRSVPHNHPNKTPQAVAEKVLHLRRKYHLGPIRIVWYLEPYHGIRISDTGVCRILKRNGLNRLPGGTRVRKIHTKRSGRSYNQTIRCLAGSLRLQCGRPGGTRTTNSFLLLFMYLLNISFLKNQQIYQQPTEGRKRRRQAHR